MNPVPHDSLTVGAVHGDGGKSGPAAQTGDDLWIHGDPGPTDDPCQLVHGGIAPRL